MIIIIRYEKIPKGILHPYYLTVEAGLQKLEHSFLSIQILMSVRPTFITVMSKLSVITLRDRLIARAALDTQEMEHHAPVNHHVQCNKNHNYNEVRVGSTHSASVSILPLYRSRSAKVLKHFFSLFRHQRVYDQRP